MSVLDRYIVRTILGSVLLVTTVLLVLGALFVFIDQQDDIGVGHYTAVSALWFTLLNLPQLSIMISLQVSANRALAASDARAIADHETLHAIHELAKMQIQILDGQNQVLELLKKAHPMPTGQPG